ncbi:hypothetical protein BURPS305_3777 [Burkholderia pseudomallei 305]|nr:hypothetical protein BURPS305_3777 [Burkholderia pseudomallei 305]
MPPASPASCPRCGSSPSLRFHLRARNKWRPEGVVAIAGARPFAAGAARR